jgi:hypothetical protein
MRRLRFMKAKAFDRKFDKVEKIIDELDLTEARCVGRDPKRMNVGSRLGWLTL